MIIHQPLRVRRTRQLLRSFIVWFLKPSLKGILRIVKQEYYDSK